MSEGFEPGKAEKPKVLKFKRVQAIKLICFPPIVCLTLWKICFNYKSVSVVLREICLVKIPELWNFCSNQWFLFLLTNVLVITLTFLSGSLAPSNGKEEIYEEFVKRIEAARKYNASRPVSVKKQNQISSQAPSFRQKNSGEVGKRRFSKNPETRKQMQSSEAKSLVVMEVPSGESATVSTYEVHKRSEAETSTVTEVPTTESAKVSAEETLRGSEAGSLILIEVPSNEPASVSAEEFVSRSNANSLILMEASCLELANSSDEEFNKKMDEFIADFKGRLGKEESVAFYQEMKRRIVK